MKVATIRYCNLLEFLKSFPYVKAKRLSASDAEALEEIYHIKRLSNLPIKSRQAQLKAARHQNYCMTYNFRMIMLMIITAPAHVLRDI